MPEGETPLRSLAPPLILACEPCRRRGCYRVAHLMARFGADATLEAVRLALITDCRWHRDPRLRQGNQYVPRCQARFLDYRIPPNARKDDQRLSLGRGAIWRIDEWLPGREGIARELAHVSDLKLAHRTFDAAVDLDPHAPITLRQGSHLMRETHPKHIDYDPHGRGEHRDTHQISSPAREVTRHGRRR